jgi:hypothetical protein
MQHTTVEIMGGLGNQLFQIFALLAHCLHYKLPFYFSTVPIQHGQRKQTYWHTPLLKSLQPFVKASPSSTTPPRLLREQGFHYQPIPFYDHGHVEPIHVKLFGYFQSYKYFQAQKEQIYKLLRIKQTQDLIKEKTKTSYTNLIAVHFRVGDYVQLPNHHPLMPLEYYTQALNQFLQDQSPALCETLEQAKQIQSTWNVLYFCEKNDQAYVEKQFIKPLQSHPQFQGKFHFQCIDHQLADWEQLIVMSLCQYHIIANSTFSWWGAYLLGGTPPTTPTSAAAQHGGMPLSTTSPTSAAAQHGGVWGVKPHVYYPSLWFGPAMGQKNMTDLFPPHWQMINVENIL